MTGPDAPGQRDWWLVAGIALTAVAAAVASFLFLTSLAAQAGWPAQAAPLLPVSVDALAATALRIYLTEPAGGVRRFAGRCAAGAVAVSAAGNAASHLFAAGVIAPGWAAITLVGTVPAVSLGLVVHLAGSRARVGAVAGAGGRRESAPARARVRAGSANVPLAEVLASLGVPVEAGRDRCRRALSAAGVAASNAAISAAIQARRNGVSAAPT